MEQRCLRSLGGGGIGALAVHPSRQFLAVGEKGKQPVIAIFTYPQLQLHRVLKGLQKHSDVQQKDSQQFLLSPNLSRRYRRDVQSHELQLW